MINVETPPICEPVEPEEVWGDTPPDLELIPGVIRLDGIAGPSGLEAQADTYLATKPQILALAKQKGKDLVAFASSHGKQILIGVGVASIVTGATAGGIILYKHRNPRKKHV